MGDSGPDAGTAEEAKAEAKAESADKGAPADQPREEIHTGDGDDTSADAEMPRKEADEASKKADALAENAGPTASEPMEAPGAPVLKHDHGRQQLLVARLDRLAASSLSLSHEVRL